MSTLDEIKDMKRMYWRYKLAMDGICNHICKPKSLEAFESSLATIVTFDKFLDGSTFCVANWAWKVVLDAVSR